MILNQRKLLKKQKFSGLWSILLVGIVVGGICFWIMCRTPNEWERYSKQTVEYFYGKELILPMQDSVQNLSISDLKDILANSSLKIATCFDGDCSVCVLKLDFWRRFMQSLEQEDIQMPILIYAHSTNKENITQLMKVAWPQGQPWIYDRNKNFIIANELYDDHFQTLLLNQKNEIILIGDPTLNKGMEDLFMKTILSYSE